MPEHVPVYTAVSTYVALEPVSDRSKEGCVWRESRLHVPGCSGRPAVVPLPGSRGSSRPRSPPGPWPPGRQPPGCWAGSSHWCPRLDGNWGAQQEHSSGWMMAFLICFALFFLNSFCTATVHWDDWVLLLLKNPWSLSNPNNNLNLWQILLWPNLHELLYVLAAHFIK